MNGVRRTTLAARLKAIYGTVDKVDAFVGMVSERTRAAAPSSARSSSRSGRSSSPRCATATGSSTPATRPWSAILLAYGINFRNTLADVVFLNTGQRINNEAFQAEDGPDQAVPAPPDEPPTDSGGRSPVIVVRAPSR